MKMDVKKWCILGAIFTIVVGTLLHFLYEWTSNNIIVGILSAVNESTWEHLKLLFWPALAFSIIQYFAIGKNYNNVITATAVSLYLGITLIVILFYTYTGIIETNYLIIDILIFIVSVIISQYVGYKITTSEKCVSKSTNLIAFISIIILATAFVVFTFNPPQIPLFQDPITGTYGI